MTVSPLVLILLSLGCGVFLGVIGLAVAQGLQKQPDHNPWEHGS